MSSNPLDEEAEQAFLLGNNKPGICEHCARQVDHLFSTPSQTLYSRDTWEEDPNRARDLCLDCSADYTEMMDERWREYYSGIM